MALHEAVIHHSCTVLVGPGSGWLGSDDQDQSLCVTWALLDAPEWCFLWQCRQRLALDAVHQLTALLLHGKYAHTSLPGGQHAYSTLMRWLYLFQLAPTCSQSSEAAGMEQCCACLLQHMQLALRRPCSLHSLSHGTIGHQQTLQPCWASAMGTPGAGKAVRDHATPPQTTVAQLRMQLRAGHVTSAH